MSASTDELLRRREALRALDRRLTALTTDVDHIRDPANRVHLGAGPIRVSFDIGTAGPEGQVLEELIEISAELRSLTDEVVPEISTDAGWSPTAHDRVPEHHASIDELQALVREAFAAVEAALPPELPREPLADISPDPKDAELVAEGDHRSRNRTVLQVVWTAAVLSFFVWVGLVDMDAVATACATTPPCTGDDPEVALHPNGWIVVHRKTASCEDGVRVLFDRKGGFVERVSPGEQPRKTWPKKPARARAACSNMDDLRWTWVIGWGRN